MAQQCLVTHRRTVEALHITMSVSLLLDARLDVLKSLSPPNTQKSSPAGCDLMTACGVTL